MSRWTLACLVVCLASTLGERLVAAELKVDTKAPMPTPAGLETDVAFWEDIFAKYRPDQCVFHDKEDLGIVYFVKTVPGETSYAQAKNIRRYLGAIRAGLKHLGGGGEARNLLERRLVAATPKASRIPSYFRNALENVRCQRGVDLGPSFARSRKHMGMVKRVLAKKGLPEDLAYLPHLESGYHLYAKSRAGARGLWQLMPATARLQGLKVTRSRDQRTEASTSTVAAARLLRQLHASTGSWPLTITAYNYGPNGMRRAIQQWGRNYMTIREKHKTRIFGFAARNYYPSFLAVRNVATSDDLGAAASDPVALDEKKSRNRSL